MEGTFAGDFVFFWGKALRRSSLLFAFGPQEIIPNSLGTIFSFVKN
jgi:hypothetical protein